MRIWAFPSFYPYDYPGLKWNGIFAHRQYKGLQESGADIKVIQPVVWHPVAPFHRIDADWRRWATYKYPLERVYDGLTVYHPRIANMKPSRLFRKKYSEKYADAIVDFFKNNNIKTDKDHDIFFAQWLPDAAMVMDAAHRMGLKCAVVMIGDDALIWPYSTQSNFDVIKHTLIHADMRFAVAGRLAVEANKIAGMNLSCNIIRRGVNYDFFKPVSATEKAELRKTYGIPEGKKVILTVGTANVRKGWLDLFDALKEVKKTESDFVLVGVQGGHSDFDLNAEAAKRGLQDIFINLVEVEPALINGVHNIADIFCLPSHSEGIANSVVEAMSTGVAVIATDVGSHDELIQNGVNGMLLPAQQPALLAETINRLLNDAALRAELGKNAREFIVTKWGSFAENAAKLYKQLCSA